MTGGWGVIGWGLAGGVASRWGGAGDKIQQHLHRGMGAGLNNGWGLEEGVAHKRVGLGSGQSLVGAGLHWGGACWGSGRGALGGGRGLFAWAWPGAEAGLGLGQGGLWGEWGLNGTGAPREGFGGPRRGQGSIGGTEVPSGGSPKATGFGGAFGLSQLWRAGSAGGFGEALRGQGSMAGVWGERDPVLGPQGYTGPRGGHNSVQLWGAAGMRPWMGEPPSLGGLLGGSRGARGVWDYLVRAEAGGGPGELLGGTPRILGAGGGVGFGEQPGQDPL